MTTTSNSYIAGQLNIIAKAGDSFIRDFTFTTDDTVPVPIDLSNYKVKLQVRKTAKNAQTVLSASLSNYISIGGTDNNVISVSVPASAMAFAAGTYLWDLELTSPENIVITYLEGDFKLEQDVTR